MLLKQSRFEIDFTLVYHFFAPGAFDILTSYAERALYSRK